MSSFYSDASIVLIPSGYKNQKIYCAKPTDGTGDLTFSRASSATRVQSNGLIEKVRTNVVTYSQDFNDASWTKTALTISTSATANPVNGALTAQDAIPTAVSSTHRVFKLAGVVNTANTWSIYAKAKGYNFITIVENGNTSASVSFNLSTGAVSTQISAVGQIQSLGSGWFRCSMIHTTATTPRFDVFVSPTDSVSAYTADGTSGVTLFGAQAEASDFGATPYIATTTAAVSVGPVSGLPRLDYLNSSCPRLLLEPAATALNQFSENFDNAYWIKNDVTVTSNTSETLDPSGYYGADKIVETATTARHRVASGSLNLTAVNHTSSVFMKKGTARYGFVAFSGAAVSSIVVDLDNGTITSSSTSGTIVAQKVESYGNGWYRISITALGTSSSGVTYSLQYGTAGSATPTFTSNIPSHAGSTANHIYAWGANLTATSYPQSYIPTLSTSVTRVADAASKTGISSLIGQTEGTLFVEFVNDGNNNSTIDRIISVSDGTSSNRMYLARLTGGSSYFVSVASGTQTGEITGTTMPQGVVKIAVAYKNNDVAMYVNGSLVGTDTSHTTPATSNLYLGQENAGTTNNLWKPYKQALVFKTRLSNAQLAELTTI